MKTTTVFLLLLLPFVAPVSPLQGGGSSSFEALTFHANCSTGQVDSQFKVDVILSGPNGETATASIETAPNSSAEAMAHQMATDLESEMETETGESGLDLDESQSESVYVPEGWKVTDVKIYTRDSPGKQWRKGNGQLRVYAHREKLPNGGTLLVLPSFGTIEIELTSIAYAWPLGMRIVLEGEDEYGNPVSYQKQLKYKQQLPAPLMSGIGSFLQGIGMSVSYQNQGLKLTAQVAPSNLRINKVWFAAYESEDSSTNYDDVAAVELVFDAY